MLPFITSCKLAVHGCEGNCGRIAVAVPIQAGQLLHMGMHGPPAPPLPPLPPPGQGLYIHPYVSGLLSLGVANHPVRTTQPLPSLMTLTNLTSLELRDNLLEVRR